MPWSRGMQPGIAVPRFNPSCCSVSNVARHIPRCARCDARAEFPRDRGNAISFAPMDLAFSFLYVILPPNGKRRSDIFASVFRNGEVSGFIVDRRDVFGGIHWHLLAPSFFPFTPLGSIVRWIGVCYSMTRKTCSMASVKRKRRSVWRTTCRIICNSHLLEVRRPFC